MSSGTHVNEPWHTYKWVMAHIQMSHGTRSRRGQLPCCCLSKVCESFTQVNESWQTYTWVMAHIWTGHVTQMKESGFTNTWVSHSLVIESYERVMHLWMSHIIYRSLLQKNPVKRDCVLQKRHMTAFAIESCGWVIDLSMRHRNEYSLFCRALLQKRPVILRRLHAS